MVKGEFHSWTLCYDIVKVDIIILIHPESLRVAP